MNGQTRPIPVTVGFVPLIDAALLVVAREEGFASMEGLDLTLVREGSWAAIRDKLNVGLFDAAHMLAPAAIASTLGLGHLQVPLIAPLALNLDGNAITVSNALADELRALIQPGEAAVSPGQTAKALATVIAQRARNGLEPITVGVVFGFSCHVYQMQAWLGSGGINLERDTRLVVIPPPLMVESLAAGLVDVFCAGAPWNRLAEAAGAGRVLHPCASFSPDCPEKLLVLRQDRQGASWLAGLIRAIVRASLWASEPNNLRVLARHLARPDYIGAPVGVIEAVLAGHAPTLFNAAPTSWIRLDQEATLPAVSRLRAVFDMMVDAGQITPDQQLWTKAMGIARPDLYAKALAGTLNRA